MGISTKPHSKSMHLTSRYGGASCQPLSSSSLISNSYLASCAKHVGYLALLGVLFCPQTAWAGNTVAPTQLPKQEISLKSMGGSTSYSMASTDSINCDRLYAENSWNSKNESTNTTTEKVWRLDCLKGGTVSFEWITIGNWSDRLTISINDSVVVDNSYYGGGEINIPINHDGAYLLKAVFQKGSNESNYGSIQNISVYPIPHATAKGFMDDKLADFPGLKSELQAALDKMENEDAASFESNVELDKVYKAVVKAYDVNALIPEDLATADSILNLGAYVEIAEAVKQAKALDANTSKSADYLAAFEALETSIGVQKSSQIEMSNWAFENTAYKIDGLRYYLDKTNHLAKFIGFDYSSKEKSLEIPSSVRKDGEVYTVVAMENVNIYNQDSIRTVILPKTLRYIGDNALCYYQNLTYLEIPENVTQIGSDIFYGTNNLKHIKIDAIVPPTGGSLSGASNKKIYIPEDCFHAYRLSNVWNSNVLVAGEGTSVSLGKITAGDLGHVILDEATYLQEVNKLTVAEGTLNNDDWNTLKSMTNLIELDISGMTVISVPQYAFDGNWGLEKVIFPKKLESIGSFAFRNTGLQEIDLPESLTSMGQYAFADCEYLAKVKYPAKMEYIPDYCFNNCRRLSDVELQNGLLNIYRYAFTNCRSLENITFPSTLITIGNDAFSSANLKEIVIPSSVNTIYGRAFQYNTNLKEVTFNEGLNSIEYDAYRNCSSLEAITFPSTLTKIGSSAFAYCYGLKDIEFNEGLISIEDEAFRRCTNLSEIVLPSTLEKCLGRSFQECYNIKKVEARSVVPPVTDNNNPLYGVDLTGVTLSVPSWSTGEYQLAGGWNSFYTVEASDYLPQNIKVNRDFYFALGDMSIEEYRPNITMTWSNVQSSDAAGNYNYERGNLTVSGRSKLAVNDFSMVMSPYAKYFSDYNIRWGNSWGSYTTPYNGTSLIVNGEMRAEDVTLHLCNYRSMWQFVSFPFDVKVSDIVPESENTSWVIRGHSGAKRAEGKSSEVWENLGSDAILKAGKGYIMHCYNPDADQVWFTVSPLKESVNRQLIFSADDRTLALEENLSEFEHNRSWNLIGNPYPSFYDSRFLDFGAPFMVWNSCTQSYWAYNPADDAYILSPGEAFFVQRPVDEENIIFKKEGRQLDGYARALDDNLSSKAMARVSKQENRSIYNLTLSNETYSDRTRIVLNNAASMGYEMNRDAAKFASIEASVPQIYSWNADSRYAINERPAGNGVIALGVHCGTAGTYTIALANEVNGIVVLEDKEMNTSTEITTEKGYSFSAEVGDYDSRFVLHISNSTTGIDAVTTEAAENKDIYTIEGKKVNAVKKGNVYIQNGKKIIKK